jgi:hypothetical protein
MNSMRGGALMKVMIGLLAAAIIGTGGFAFAAGLDDTQSARTVSLPGVSSSDDTTTAETTIDDDVLGTVPATTTNRTTTNSLDISGPCDEAEHANDPRCTGAVDDDDDRDDNSGPGSGDDDDHGDRSGPNRGSDDDNNDD